MYTHLSNTHSFDVIVQSEGSPLLTRSSRRYPLPDRLSRGGPLIILDALIYCGDAIYAWQIVAFAVTILDCFLKLWHVRSVKQDSTMELAWEGITFSPQKLIVPYAIGLPILTELVRIPTTLEFNSWSILSIVVFCTYWEKEHYDNYSDNDKNKRCCPEIDTRFVHKHAFVASI